MTDELVLAMAAKFKEVSGWQVPGVVFEGLDAMAYVTRGGLEVTLLDKRLGALFSVQGEDTTQTAEAFMAGMRLMFVKAGGE